MTETARFPPLALAQSRIILQVSFLAWPRELATQDSDWIRDWVRDLDGRVVQRLDGLARWLDNAALQREEKTFTDLDVDDQLRLLANADGLQVEHRAVRAQTLKMVFADPARWTELGLNWSHAMPPKGC